MKESIMVSICCATFNHEKYIKKTLEGFLCQKTNFKYEILINDDCSSDGTRAILKEYIYKYPEIFKVYFQKENQYSKGKKIVLDILLPKAQGKYIALCEGDDYWIDECKLQKQYDAMESNKSCSLCVHKVKDVDEYGKELEGEYPSINIDTRLIKIEEFMTMTFNPYQYLFHANSFFFKKDSVVDLYNSKPDFMKVSSVGDVPLTWYLSQKGDFYYINEIMSCYRRDVAGSWSIKMQSRSFRKNMKWRYLQSIIKFDEYTNKKYHNLLENDILEAEFDYLKLSNNFIKMRDKEFKYLFSKLSLLDKLKYLLLFIFDILRNGDKNGK